MWRIFLLFISLAAFSYAQQTVVITFARDSDSQYDYCNIVTNNTNGYSIINASTLLNIDKSPFEYKISVAPINQNEPSTINTFKGDTSSITALFGDAPISGVVAYNQSTMLKFFNIAEGSYTLSVLAASGTKASSPNTDTFSIETEQDSNSVVKAEILSYNVNNIEAPKIEGSRITAYTLNNGSDKNAASNWVLMNFSINLSKTSNIILKATGTTGNVAAVKFSTIPEPSTSALLLITLTALITHRRRK